MEDLDHVKQAVKGDLAYLQPPAQSRDMKPAASLLVRQQPFSLLPPTA